MSLTTWVFRILGNRSQTNPASHRLKRRTKIAVARRAMLERLEDRLAPSVVLSISNPADFTEGDSGTADMLFVVTRSGDLGPAVQVNYATHDGSAHAGVDYVATSGILTFAPNQTVTTI